MESGDARNGSTGDATAAPSRRKIRATALALGVLAGVALALVGGLAVVIAGRGQAPPTISREDLTAAERLWSAQGPASYDMDIMIGGRQPGPVHIEVRAGKVTRMTRDGITPTQARTWEYWTVPEQLETIRQDFDSAETQGGFGAPAGAETILKAQFDPQYGYPRRYQRIVLGTDLDVEWEATRFVPLP